jgi:hypothetical protein
MLLVRRRHVRHDGIAIVNNSPACHSFRVRSEPAHEKHYDEHDQDDADDADAAVSVAVTITADIRQLMPVVGTFVGMTDAFIGMSAEVLVTS